MRTVRFHPQAQIEAESAAEWYESRRSGLGREFLAELDRACILLSESPIAWPLWPKVARALGIRRFLLSRFPFALAYTWSEDVVVVLAVAHLARKPGYWKERADS